MRLNPKKCRELVINFLQYLPARPDSLHIDGSQVRRVDTYKILGVHLSSDLTWNVHIEYIAKKANKRLSKATDTTAMKRPGNTNDKIRNLS